MRDRIEETRKLMNIINEATVLSEKDDSKQVYNMKFDFHDDIDDLNTKLKADMKKRKKVAVKKLADKFKSTILKKYINGSMISDVKFVDSEWGPLPYIKVDGKWLDIGDL